MANFRLHRMTIIHHFHMPRGARDLLEDATGLGWAMCPECGELSGTTTPPSVSVLTAEAGWGR